MPTFPKSRKPAKGFTLAEFLISLAIIGMIAAIAIPKIITSSQNQNYNTAAKEVASTVSAIYQKYYMDVGGESYIQNIWTLSGFSWDSGMFTFLPPNLNYIKQLTSGEVITYPPAGAASLYAGINTCGALKCYLLPSGGVLWWAGVPYMWSGLWQQVFYYDPDGSGPAESQGFIVYCSTLSGKQPGRVVTVAQGTSHYYSADASWFSW